MPTAAELNQHPALVRYAPYGELAASELQALMSLISSSRRLPKGSIVHHEGDPNPGVHLLLEGWTASSMSTARGGRQLLKVHLAGDLIGMPALPYKTAPDTVISLTPIMIGSLDLNALGKLFQDAPRLAAVLFMISQEERLMLMDRLFLIGKQGSTGRVAGLILQLHSRVLRQSPEVTDTIELPLTQTDVADLIGITSVHMNRTLQELRARAILTWSRKKIVLHDLGALRELAGFPERTLADDHSWLPEIA